MIKITLDIGIFEITEENKDSEVSSEKKLKEIFSILEEKLKNLNEEKKEILELIASKKEKIEILFTLAKRMLDEYKNMDEKDKKELTFLIDEIYKNTKKLL